MEPIITLPITSKLPLKDLRTTFAIDTSQSVKNIFADDIDYLTVEKYFISTIAKNLKYPATLISWNIKAHIIKNINNITTAIGTKPSCIFDNSKTITAIKNTDVLFLLTDGIIGFNEMNNFNKKILEHAAHLKAIVGVIIGRRTQGSIIKNPHNINISTLIPAMISNSCILFFNLKSTYLMWSTTIFATTYHPHNIKSDTTWDQVTTISNIHETLIPICDPILNYIPIGNNTHLNLEYFLNHDADFNILPTYLFNQICQQCSMTHKLINLYDWLHKQKNRFISTLADDTSYIKIRNCKLAECYVNEINRNNDLGITDIYEDEQIGHLLLFFKKILQITNENIKIANTASSYTSGNYSNHRYIFNPNAEITNAVSYNFADCHRWIKYNFDLCKINNSPIHQCSICLEVDSPCILLKKIINDITHLIQNPDDYISVSFVCSKCATYHCKTNLALLSLPIISIREILKIDYLACFSDITIYTFSKTETLALLNSSSPETIKLNFHHWLDSDIIYTNSEKILYTLYTIISIIKDKHKQLLVHDFLDNFTGQFI